ncbi:MAG: CinA family nicotinamide mononucleotide deamidase-related protein [SAR324 cluster bacterium]|nr:CinA family nicotinamide mononucleotide deamidase-related protein [SAR324 cluster bacterium]
MRKQSEVLKLSLLLTGNELMSGEVTDTNSVFMAKELAMDGLAVDQKLIVGDRFSSITAALSRLTEESDIIIVNGGLGSTIDDLTASAAASVAGRKLLENSRAIEHIENRLAKKFLAKNSPFYTQIKKQALIPELADLLDNPVGLALGFKLKIKRAICYFTPGVPHEMREMLRQSILPDIRLLFKLEPSVKTAHLNIIGLGESQIQQLIHNHISREVWDRVQLGFRADLCSVELKLSINDPTAAAVLADTLTKVHDLLAGYVFSEGHSLPEAVVDLLKKSMKRVAFAESCTGGLIASQITAVPGASDVFEAGIVSYSNKSKERLLNVSEVDIETFGAVSQEVVIGMVKGALAKTGADVAVAVTGVAGPTGGSVTKPVGTVYIGWGEAGNIQTRMLLIKRERTIFQQMVSAAALDLLRRYLLGLDADAIYYFDEISRKRL